MSRSETGLAFGSFFQAEYPRLVKMLYLVTGDALESEDLAQEAMARVYERWSRVRAMDAPVGYVYTVAVNLSRRRARRMSLARRAATDRSRPDVLTVAETRSDVARALASLSAGLREAVVLVEFFGLNSAEAARILRIQPSSVRSRLQRARVALRERLETSDA